MLSLKKVYRDELLQLALILSLLRVHPDSYFENDLYNSVNNLDLEISNGTSWRSFGTSVLRSYYVHPKSLDSVLLNYEREVFADLNSLGRYNRVQPGAQNITAYLLNVERTSGAVAHPNPEPAQELAAAQPPQNASDHVNNDSNEAAPLTAEVNIELTQEEMDLIEVLWKQDVDLGFSLDIQNPKSPKPELAEEGSQPGATSSLNVPNDDIEKLKALKAVNEDNIKTEPESLDHPLVDPWEGLNYTIDTETGEYVIKSELADTLTGTDSATSDLPLEEFSLPLPEFLLEEALSLVGLDDDTAEEAASKDIEPVRVNSSTDSVDLADSGTEEAAATPPLSLGDGSSAAAAKDIESDEDFFPFLNDMIQTTQFHHPHHRAFQSRMPLVRTMSMEQRWQDLANLLSLPTPGDAGAIGHHFGHHHHSLHNYSHPHSAGMSYGPEARGVLLHNATLTPPMGDINGSVPYSNIGGTNLGNAVATSMNLTNSSEAMGEPTSSHYKLEPSHDIMYYQNSTSEFNQTDGLLSSIWNDEDLQLMDMVAMNEGMYPMRMLDNNNATTSSLSLNATAPNMSRTDVERMDTSSDSAVSSMGSERVPSLSDGEWCDAGSDSGHTAGDHYVADYHSKYRPYDYSYSGRQQTPGAIGNSDASRLPPVAQKKHQMFGKRYFQEQGSASSITHPTTPIKYEYREPISTPSYSSPSHVENAIGPKPPEMKYSCTMEFGRLNNLGRSPIDHIQHNHTYHLPVESTGVMQRPISRDKAKAKKAEEEHLTRDEKRARALNVPITVDDIINLPMDEFNERLSKYDLSEAQLSLIRDIRRRGKNKVAAQNCRKRKLDQILSLADEVKEMRDRKMRLVNEHEYMLAESQRIKDKYQQLYRYVFQNLRDPEGNQYSPYHYSLQISSDDSILVVPRSSPSSSNQDRKEPPQNGRKE